MQRANGAANRSAIPNGARAGGGVGSVRKALELLASFTLATPAWALSDLARHLNLPKSTAHNLLKTLQSFDLVRQHAETREYRLGPRALELGLLFARGDEMLPQARAVLRRAAEDTGETVKLGILSNDEVLILAAVESPRQLHTRGDAGTRWPLHCTSLGKAILSALPEAEARGLLERRGMKSRTGATLTTWKAMQAELRQVRSRGYALDLEENEAGVRCAAAPLVDSLRGAAAAISISGPSVRVDEKRLRELGARAVAAARLISPQTRFEEL